MIRVHQKNLVTRLGRYFERTWLYLVMSLWLAIVLTPFAWALASSLRPDVEIFQQVSPFKLSAFLPSNPSLTSYVQVLFIDKFVVYLRNSLFVAGSVVVLGLTVNSLAAYAFARFRFPGRNLLFILVLVTFMVPFETIVVPLYIVVDQLKWINTYQALIVPSIADAVAIFLLRQFFLDIPRELEEAAAIDGANPLRTFWSVILPLAVPGLITAGLSMFVFQWNAFFWPLAATRSESMRVVQVGISLYFTEARIFWSKLFAAAVLSSLPTITLYTLLQRYFFKNISMTGLK